MFAFISPAWRLIDRVKNEKKKPCHKAELRKNLVLCNISPTDKNQTKLFLKGFEDVRKSKAAAVGPSRGQKPSGRSRLNTSHTQSRLLYPSGSKSGLPRSFLRPNRAVSQTVGRENGHYFPQPQLAVGPLLNRQAVKRDIAAVPLSHAKLLQ